MPYRDLIMGSYPHHREGVHFTDREMNEMLISIIVLTLAFYSGLRSIFWIAQPGERIFLAAAFIGASTGFFVPLFFEKRTAMRMGSVVEYRYSPLGLVIAFVSGLLGFVVAVPGRRVIYSTWGGMSSTARIHYTGSAITIGMAAFYTALAYFGMRALIPSLYIIGSFSAWISIILAAFSLLPFPMTGGSAILAWDRNRYITMWIATILLIIMIVTM